MKGLKIFEFRKRIFARKDVQNVLIYCTKPIGKLIGEFTIERILSDSPDAIWDLTEYGSCITRSFYEEYFKGKSIAHAIKIGSFRQYIDPVDPADVFQDFTPPQSYMYPDCNKFVQNPTQLKLL